MSKAIKFILGTIVLGLITSFIYDWIKQFPFLSSVWKILKWIWKTIFEFEFKVWQIILGVLVLLIIAEIIDRIKKQSKTPPSFLSYKMDKIHFFNWKWDWYFNQRTLKWNISGLKPICPECETKMHYDYSQISFCFQASCPRCQFVKGRMPELADVEAVIIDNVEKEQF